MAVHRITKGLDIPLAGEPALVVEDARAPDRVALVAADYVGLKPSVLVNVGDRVLRGTPLCEDRTAPGVRHTAPAAGTIVAVNRGDRRALQSIVIAVDAADGPAMQVPFAAHAGAGTAALDAAAVRALLLESGLWTAFRTRPFSRVPPADAVPAAIFVTAIDTRPHAPAPERVLASRGPDFEAGVAAIAKLTEGNTYVCRAPGSAIPVPDIPRVVCEEFAGPHPAGTAGVHIEALAPVGHERTAWHVGYQDVAAIGRLVTTGELDVERVITLAGPGAARPRYLRTRVGASVASLVDGELAPGVQRVISGSALDGRTAAGDVHGYLGRYHVQVAVVPEGTQREMFGYIAPGREQVLAVRRRAGRVGPSAPAAADDDDQRRRARDGADRRVRARDAAGHPADVPAARADHGRRRAGRAAGRAGARRGGPGAVHVRLPRQGRVRAAVAPRARAAGEGARMRRQR